ncbi:MAG TPA: VWA domain-containing protein [Pyrinomonadaceae bacterium]|nr:VWA domain-containing protein [Pyrinomonadaceae bacterium]
MFETATGRRARRLLSAVAALLLCLAAPGGVRAQAQEDVVRVESELVQTDVMVFDKAGRFVEGLGREQFELKVDGRPVPLAFFERVSAPPKPGEGAPGAAAAAANAAAASRARGRTTVFFIDDLHLSLDSLNPTRAAITRFIDEEMAPGDLVAIVTASGQLGFLSQFTDNKAVLRAAVARLRHVPDTTRDTEQPPMSEFIATRIANGDRQAAAFYVDKFVEGTTSKTAAKAGAGMNVSAIYEMVRNRATNITKQMEAVTNGSLASLHRLVRLTGQIEGRKLVFFISDGFYLDGRNTTAPAGGRLQLVTGEAARTGTVIYSIDARGLFAPFNDATGLKPRDPNGRLDRASIGEGLLAQEGLANLADETGGQFLKNQNYFDRWVSRVVEETSNFYRIAWKPEADEQKGGRFKRVEVAVVGRPELTVRLHRGYVPAAARASEEAKKGGAKADANAAPPKGAEADLRAALMAPAARRGLPLALSASFVDVPGSGPVLTGSVEVGTAALDYGADGKQPASVDLVGVVLNEQGKTVSSFTKRLTVAPGSAPAGEQAGVIYNHKAPLAPGLYQLKAAAREARGGQLGSAVQWIEIPDLSKKRLALSSLHLGGRQVGGGADGGAPQIQFSVDKRFPRSAKVDFLGFVYNAARAGAGVDLSVNLRVLRDNKALVSSPARKLTPEAGADLARIPVTGAISLGQLPPGRYELEVNVTDNVARTTAVERVMFEIK